MPFFRRPEGTLATGLPGYRRMMPFIMRNRMESNVYFEQQFDLTKTLPFIKSWNASHGNRISFFHLFMYAAVKALHERPRLNRFVAGSHIYQRDGIWLSYTAKKAKSDDAPMVELKRRFDPTHTFEQLVSFMYEDLSHGRSDELTHSDKEVEIFLKIPAFLLRIFVAIVFKLDAWNLLPGFFVMPDPFYASMFVANLGSIKLEAAYHHLYEYGNIPIFAAIGRIKRVAHVTDEGEIVPLSVCDVKYNFDERVEDGLYCATSLDRLRQIVEDPEKHVMGNAVAAGQSATPVASPS